jgi:hypothetical protein
MFADQIDCQCAIENIVTDKNAPSYSQSTFGKKPRFFSSPVELGALPCLPTIKRFIPKYKLIKKVPIKMSGS